MPAIWTTPRTWLTGEVLTAANLNTHLRDNFEYAKSKLDAGPGAYQATNGALLSTSSTTFVDAGYSITWTATGAVCIAELSGQWTQSAGGNRNYIQFVLDGVALGNAGDGIMDAAPGTSYQPLYAGWMFTPSPGSHTIKVQWRVSAGSGTMNYNAMTRFRLLDLRA